MLDNSLLKTTMLLLLLCLFCRIKHWAYIAFTFLKTSGIQAHIIIKNNKGVGVIMPASLLIKLHSYIFFHKNNIALASLGVIRFKTKNPKYELLLSQFCANDFSLTDFSVNRLLTISFLVVT